MYIIDLIKIAEQLDKYNSTLSSKVDDATRKILYAEQRTHVWLKYANQDKTLKIAEEQFTEIVQSCQILKKIADTIKPKLPELSKKLNDTVQAGLYDWLDRLSTGILRGLPGQAGKNERVLAKVESLADMAAKASANQDLTPQVEQLDAYLKREIPRDQYIRKFGQNVLRAIHEWWQSGKNNQVLYNGLRFALTGFDPNNPQGTDAAGQQSQQSTQLLQLVDEFIKSNENVKSLWQQFLNSKQQSQT